MEEPLKSRTHLFMGEAQLVLQDSLAIRQCLNLIGEGVESICQRVREVKILHALWPRWMRRRRRKKRSIKKKKRKKAKFLKGRKRERDLPGLKKGTEEAGEQVPGRSGEGWR